MADIHDGLVDVPRAHFAAWVRFKNTLAKAHRGIAEVLSPRLSASPRPMPPQIVSVLTSYPVLFVQPGEFIGRHRMTTRATVASRDSLGQQSMCQRGLA